MIHLARHQSVLQRLGLAALDQVRVFQGETIKVHGEGRRDILRIQTHDETGAPLVLYLKRTWRAYTKDGLRTLLRHGRAHSVSWQEWENSLSLQRAGLKTAPLVAYGEDCGWFRERFSFLITESVEGKGTLEQFLHECHDLEHRRRVLDALARNIRRMHEAGLAMPDLFTRHIFLELTGDQPAFHFIDVARLDRRAGGSVSGRVRDLAALNVTAPLRHVSMRERLRFLRIYDGWIDRKLVAGISARMKHLLRRRKYAGFYKRPDHDSDNSSRLQFLKNDQDVIQNSSLSQPSSAESRP